MRPTDLEWLLDTLSDGRKAARSKAPLGRAAAARQLRPLSTRLAAPGSCALLAAGPLGAQPTASAARASRLQSHLWPSGKVICIELPKRGDSSGPLFHSVRAGGEDVAAHRLAES